MKGSGREGAEATPKSGPLDDPTSRRASADFQPVLHEVRNRLAVAIASVEGIIDGKFDAASRMPTLLETLRKVSALLDDSRS